jgi:hypothetical protein
MSHTKNSCKVNSSTKRGAGLAALVLACSLILCLTLSGCAKAVTPAGPWHNDELGQLLRFHDDGTVVIRTPYGDSEATWIFDKDGKQGVITLKGEAIGFVLDGDSLLLTWGEVQTTFVSGDMEVVAAIAEATPISTPTPAVSLEPSATPAPTATPTPTETPAPTATPSASSSAPKWSFGAFPDLSFVPIATPTPLLSVNPHLSSGLYIPGDILGSLTGSIVGKWYYTGDDDFVLTFLDDDEFTLTYKGTGITGTYIYNKSARTGTLVTSGQALDFEVNGDLLTLTSGETFKRE